MPLVGARAAVDASRLSVPPIPGFVTPPPSFASGVPAARIRAPPRLQALTSDWLSLTIRAAEKA
jgi:hypothetical protein